MAGRYKGWLIGCGIGCAIVILGVVALVGGAAWFVRDTAQGFDEATEMRQELEARFGDPEMFTPWPTGAIPPERMEAFLAVREQTHPARTEIRAFFDSIPMTVEQAREMESKPTLEQLRSVFSITRGGFGMAGDLGRFYETRNRVLLESGMGMGEYTYIYSVAYYAGLDHPPGDGPQTAQLGSPSGRSMFDLLSGRVQRELRLMLGNQLESLDDPELQQDWRDSLAAEIVAMNGNPGHFPWQEELPPAIAASIEPYRERLETTYDATTNPFELARSDKSKNNLNIKID